MTTVTFTPNLQRHIATPGIQLAGATVGEVLEAYFRQHPQVRGYVLDDQGGVHKHVAIFLNAALVRDRNGLTDPVREADEIFVAQALSGG